MTEPEGQKPKPSPHRLAPDRAQAIRTNPPINMSVLEGAAYISCSSRKLRDLINDRRVKCARIGSKIVLRREWLDDFLEGSSR